MSPGRPARVGPVRWPNEHSCCTFACVAVSPDHAALRSSPSASGGSGARSARMTGMSPSAGTAFAGRPSKRSPGGETSRRRRGAPPRRADGETLRRLRGRAAPLGAAGPEEPPIGMVFDRAGIYYEASKPSDLLDLVASSHWFTPAMADRAEGPGCCASETLEIQCRAGAFAAGARPRKAALIRGSWCSTRCTAMPPSPAHRPTPMPCRDACRALEENPRAEIVVKLHPDVLSGRRAGISRAPPEPADARSRSRSIRGRCFARSIRSIRSHRASASRRRSPAKTSSPSARRSMPAGASPTTAASTSAGREKCRRRSSSPPII